MENKAIEESIRREELHLEFFEKIKYFRVPVICLLIAIVCLTNGFSNFRAIYLVTVPQKVGIIFLIFSIGSFILKLRRLKLISVNVVITEPQEKILSFANKRKMVITQVHQHAIILKTMPPPTSSDRFLYDQTPGEIIYIFFTANKILFRSIDNLENTLLNIQNGGNQANEKALKILLKPTANSW
jgi:hypothetical protein